MTLGAKKANDKDRKLTILNIGAHAFDLMKGPGGTCIKYARKGHRVVPLILSYCDERGELPPHISGKEAAEIQREEVRQASKFCGFDPPRFLSYTEIELANMRESWECTRQIADVIRDVKPDIIFTHWPEDQTQGFYNHANAGILGEKAMKIAAMPDYVSDLPLHETKLILYYLSTEFTPAHLTWKPDIFINVTDEIQQVHQTFQIHRTHTGSEDDGSSPSLLREYRLVLRRFMGILSGVLYAEAFKLPQYIGAQLAFNELPDQWLTTSGGAILSHVTDKETGSVAHPRLSIPRDWPESVPLPAGVSVKLPEPA